MSYAFCIVGFAFRFYGKQMKTSEMLRGKSLRPSRKARIPSVSGLRSGCKLRPEHVVRTFVIIQKTVVSVGGIGHNLFPSKHDPDGPMVFLRGKD
jgi:hypothetical protein